MVKNQFETILSEIGQVLNIELHPDTANACLIQMPSGVLIKIEMDKQSDSILIGSEIGTLQKGRYRENIFREVLKANAILPINGIFAYSKKAEKLILFIKIPLNDYHADKIPSFLPPFLEKAFIWKEAISRGEIPTATQSQSTGMFGLSR